MRWTTPPSVGIAVCQALSYIDAHPRMRHRGCGSATKRRNPCSAARHDAAFHRAVVTATGNESLLTLLEGISGRTLRARIWRGLVDDKAAGRTLAEHEAIFNALSTRDAALSQAAALLHVSNTEQWLREHLRAGDTHPFGTTARN
ncbi:hypothetical protein SVIOM74S_01178 [Streptomyces violarus]